MKNNKPDNLRIKLLIVFLLLAVCSRAQFSLSGKVMDAASGELLAFVSITVNNTQTGTTTDIDGKFELKSNEAIKHLKFTYVGYEAKQVEVKEGETKMTIKLKPSSVSLSEVVIRPGENPAHIILRKVIKNKDLNNPYKLNSFSYSAYSKMRFGATLDSVKLEERKDSAYIRAERFFEKQYLFLIEQASDKKFKAPDKEVETVTATKVAGFQNPSFLSLFTQMMSFGFYKDLITISDKNYVNPIASGTFNKYSFLLEDTLYQGVDSVYIISFKPKKGTNFDGLKGVLYINTNGYALSNVIAQPLADDQGTTIKIQQKYEFINGEHWFPTQLNSDIVFGGTKINGNMAMTGVGRTYIKDIKINPTLWKKDFKQEGVVINDDAYKKEDAFWNTYRADSLNNKDLKTYLTIDSIGKKEKFDKKLKTAELLLTNRLRYKIIDFELDKFILYNDYEGFRLGAAASTNEKFIKWVSLSAYGAYGFKDKASKYGAGLKIYLNQNRNSFFKIAWSQDIVESGGTEFYGTKSFLAMNEELRKILLERMDSLQKIAATLDFKPFKYSRALIYVEKQHRITTENYSYKSFSDNKISGATIFDIVEGGIKLRYNYGEQILKFGNFEFTSPGATPMIYLNYAHGMGISATTFNYNRIDFKAEKTFKSKFFGNAHVQVHTGYIDNAVPYTYLYNGKGSNKRTLSLSVPNTFETMRMNEFAANRFAAIFLTHDFGHLLFKTKKFQPTFAVKANAGWGALDNKGQHSGLSIQSYEKGFYETGLLINSLIKSGFSSIGLGIFYRVGPYAANNVKSDLAVKLSIAASF